MGSIRTKLEPVRVGQGQVENVEQSYSEVNPLLWILLHMNTGSLYPNRTLSKVMLDPSIKIIPAG